MSDVVRLLHEIDGHLGLAIHRKEHRTNEDEWLREAEDYRRRLRASIPRVEDLERAKDEAQKSFARLYDDTRCPEPNCDGQVGHEGKHFAWVAD